MLDLFCGSFGWSKAFAARGWECVGVDQVVPGEIPQGCEFVWADVRGLSGIGRFDFVCASSPCEEFSIFGMKHFHPHPAYPARGIELFNHTRKLLWSSGIPWVMENVRPAQMFVGDAVITCGPFALWGTGVPTLIPQGITKGFGAWDREYILTTGSSKSKRRMEMKAKWAEIPPELAGCVADYAGRLMEQNGPQKENNDSRAAAGAF
jgi:hypothetical protein